MSNLPSSPLVEIFGSSSSAGLLVFLVVNHGSEFAVKDISDRTKLSKPRVSKMLKGFLKYGIIKETKKVGKISYYRYDRNSKYGKFLYELVFNCSALGAAPQQPVAAPPVKPRDNGASKIIIA
ncbi:hypothetical protein CUJ83_07155 [Methanocella sp. CWC-04]|uniref:Uncharacterized protein n=1 Tax=Methanooceanicella nereidis TaxID=2052831 RepID=A0AAP2REV0_9EURY|nr:hypothetical protein [Methanocella sp. CWC-04]MCD1294775.1 hypothetical protein [Methanocella sp. CWC-04]